MSEIDPKLSRLYREASSEGPPAALDAAILAAARKQIAKPQRRARSFWVRWMAPASALATLVVAVSIAFLVERERPETLDGTAIREVSPRPQSPPPAHITETTKPKAADSAAPAAAERKEAPAAADRATVEAASRKDAPAAAAPAARSAEPAPPAAQAFPAESRAKAITPETAARKTAAEPNVAGDSAIGRLGATAPAAPAAAGKLAPTRQHGIQRSPEAWLEEISRLKREGSDKEAAEQLAEFRKIYPAYAVPENLLK